MANILCSLEQCDYWTFCESKGRCIRADGNPKGFAVSDSKDKLITYFRGQIEQAMALLRAVDTACTYDSVEQADKGAWSLPADVLIPISLFIGRPTPSAKPSATTGTGETPAGDAAKPLWPSRVTPETITPEQIREFYTNGTWPEKMVYCDVLKIIGDLAIRSLDLRSLPVDGEARDAQAWRERNTPEIHDFIIAVQREAIHQRERWGTDHDGGKEPEDWLWLVAYLATKASQAHRYGDTDKYLHHIITCAAACLNWHANANGDNTAMRAGTAMAGAALRKDAHD